MDKTEWSKTQLLELNLMSNSEGQQAAKSQPLMPIHADDLDIIVDFLDWNEDVIDFVEREDGGVPLTKELLSAASEKCWAENVEGKQTAHPFNAIVIDGVDTSDSSRFSKPPTYVMRKDATTQSVYHLSSPVVPPMTAKVVVVIYYIFSAARHLNATVADTRDALDRNDPAVSVTYYGGLFMLKDISNAMRALKSVEDVRKARVEAGRRGYQAADLGKYSAKENQQKKDKNIDAIVEAIRQLRKDGQKITKVNISRLAGISTVSIWHHWNDERVQAALISAP